MNLRCAWLAVMSAGFGMATQPERTRQEDRRSNFYEISDNLVGAGGLGFGVG